MKKPLSNLTALVAAVTFPFYTAVAGPGGEIASSIFHGIPGPLKIFVLIGMVALCILLLPLIVWNYVAQYKARKAARLLMGQYARQSPLFDPVKIENRVTDCFMRIHAAWSSERIEDAAAWMSDWYWQNQKLVFLDEWQAQGLRNICRVQSIKSIEPLYFAGRSEKEGQFDGSFLTVLIKAEMEDYLVERAGGKVVKGEKGVQSVERLWSLELTDGTWRVCRIENHERAFEYAKKMIAEYGEIRDRETGELDRIAQSYSKR